MFFIIGINHCVQCWYEENSTATINFKSLLEDEVKRRNIQLIAEEFSEEAIRRQLGETTVAKIVCQSMNIHHKYCDPDPTTRAQLGIPKKSQIKKELGLDLLKELTPEEKLDLAQEIRKYYPIRERYWFSQVRDFGDMNVIFICGTSHVESFTKLLNNEGFATELLCRDWYEEHNNSN